MEELRQVAKAYYDNGTGEVQRLACDFFRTMDHNGDGQISLQEFLAFTRQEPTFSRMNNPYFFKELSSDESSLYFWDVMAVYYIVKSGRPFCDCCGVLVTGLYFSCVKCFQRKGQTTCNLCFKCYKTGGIIHDHTNFLDNYTLLEIMRNKAFAEAEDAQNIQRHELTISELHTVVESQATNLASMALTISKLQTAVQSQATSTALKGFKAAKVAFKALECGIQAANFAFNCSIM